MGTRAVILAALASLLTPDGVGNILLGQSPPQFDASLKLTTMAALQRALGNRQALTGIGVPTTLTAANAGQLIVYVAAVAITLPLASTFPSGASIEFVSGANGCSVVRQGSDTINAGPSTVTSMAINAGDSLTLVSNSSGWYVAGGSAQLPFSSLFGASIATVGYQKLPSGLIIQWNGSFATSGSGYSTWTFPITFPHGIVNNLGSANNASNAAISIGFQLGGGSGVSVASMTSANAYAGASASLVAIGY